MWHKHLQWALFVLSIATCGTAVAASHKLSEVSHSATGAVASQQCAGCCENERNALASGAYGYSVLGHVWPPRFPVSRGITIAVQFTPEVKVFLHTDGTTFELWRGTARVRGNNVWQFLEDQAASCRLPADPAEAVKLLKIRWESKQLKRDQFEQVHEHFMTALTGYVSTVQERSAFFMARSIMGGGVDVSRYPIVYDNSWEHFEIEELDLPIRGKTTPMMEWVHEFRNLAGQSFTVRQTKQ